MPIREPASVQAPAATGGRGDMNACSGCPGDARQDRMLAGDDG